MYEVPIVRICGSQNNAPTKKSLSYLISKIFKYVSLHHNRDFVAVIS